MSNEAPTDALRLVPVEPTEAMLDAARGLIMSLSFGVPNYETSLSDVARSGYYGELWRDILTDEERAMKGPITKAHRAQLIYRAMLSAAPASPLPEGGGPYENVPVKRKLEAGAALRDRLKAAGDGLGSQVVADLVGSLRASHQNSAALFAELKEARAALEPFAAHCVIYQADTPPMTVMPITTEYRHIRRAFLARNGKGEGQ